MLFFRFFIDGAHTLESISICRHWFTEKVQASTKRKVLIFNLTGKRNAIAFFNELTKCDFDIVIFTPNVGSESDRAGIYREEFVGKMFGKLEACFGFTLTFSFILLLLA